MAELLNVEIMTVEQAADMLMCDKHRISERLQDGDIPGTKFGRSWVIPTRAFFDRLNQLAVEEAKQRRVGANTTGVVKAEPPKKRGRPRFVYNE